MSGLVKEFESGWKGKKGEYSRKLVEYCSSKALYEMCKDVEQTVKEGTFSQLTFDMMLAWETPTSADEQSHSVYNLFIQFLSFDVTNFYSVTVHVSM